MLCSICHTFTGTPCNVCRTASRIQFLIQKGRLHPDDEEVVLASLRSTAGVISDLVERGPKDLFGEVRPPGKSTETSGAQAEGNAADTKVKEEASEEKKRSKKDKKDKKEKKRHREDKTEGEASSSSKLRKKEEEEEEEIVEEAPEASEAKQLRAAEKFEKEAEEVRRLVSWSHRGVRGQVSQKIWLVPRWARSCTDQELIPDRRREVFQENPTIPHQGTETRRSEEEGLLGLPIPRGVHEEPKEKGIAKEARGTRPTVGGFTPIQGSDGAKGQSQGQSKGWSQSQKKASRSRGRASSRAQKASSTRRSSSKGRDGRREVEQGRVSAPQGLRSAGAYEESFLCDEHCQVLPQGVLDSWKGIGDHPGRGGQLCQGGVDRYEGRRLAPVPDRSPRPIIPDACVSSLLQPGGRSRQPPTCRGDPKAKDCTRERRRLDQEPREGPAPSSSRRASSPPREREREWGDFHLPKQSPPKKTRQTRRRKRKRRRIQKRRQKEEKEEKERKEGKGTSRGLGLRRRGDRDGWERSQERLPQERPQPVRRNGYGLQRESEGKGQPQGPKIHQEEGYQEFQFRLRNRIHELRYPAGERGGQCVRRRQQSEEDLRAVPRGTNSSGIGRYEEEPDTGVGHGPRVGQASTGLPELLPAGVAQESQWPSGEGTSESLHRPGSPSSLQTSYVCRRLDATGKEHRTRPSRGPLDRGTEARSGGSRTSNPHLFGRVRSSSERSVRRGEKPLAVVLSRWTSPTPRGSRREEQERSEGSRKRRRKRQERRQGSRREARPEEEGLKEEREAACEIPGVLAPEKNCKTGVVAPDSIRAFTPGVLAPDLKFGSIDAWAPSPVIAEQEGQAVSTLVKEGQSDMQVSYEGGLAMAPYEDSTCPVSQVKDQHNYELGARTFAISGVGAPVLNSKGGLQPPAESTDSPGGGDVPTGLPCEQRPPEKDDALASLTGKSLASCGSFLLQRILEVLPLRSKFTGRVTKQSLFPLPTSRDALVKLELELSGAELSWLISLCVSLNSLWGSELFYDGTPNETQKRSRLYLSEHVRRFCNIDAIVPELDWSDFMKVKTVTIKEMKYMLHDSLHGATSHPHFLKKSDEFLWRMSAHMVASITWKTSTYTWSLSLSGN